jgi:hypothetical protein
MLRFVQDCVPTYGARLHARRVDLLDTDHYAESPWREAPVLQQSGTGWRATGMHHLDAWPASDGGLIAAVDGNRQRLVFNWRAGARAIQRRLFAAR